MRIPSANQFDRHLDEAIQQVRLLESQNAGDPMLLSIRSQLEHLKGWVAEQAGLTQAQKDRFTLGLLAQRELRGDDPALADKVIALHNHLMLDLPTIPSAGDE
jgi:hypothetical protein